MDKAKKPFKIRLGQRWIFKDCRRASKAVVCVAEVIRHHRGSSYATIKIKQVIKPGSARVVYYQSEVVVKGKIYSDISLQYDTKWRYMAGQDRP